MNKNIIKQILGREIYDDLVNFKLDLPNDIILVTGGKGSIGQLLKDKIKCKSLIITDIDELDVTNEKQVKESLNFYKPNIIIHLAASKYAPEGEINVNETIDINTIGTINLIKYKDKDSKIILTSTCKACNPETVYGASKLIAERLVLNNKGIVARFFNVIETQGNVFELWKNQKIKKVSNCKRHFVSIDEAIGLILFSIIQKSGRYIINTPLKRNMIDIFNICYPNEKHEIIQPRRGDRIIEKWISDNENIEDYLFNDAVLKIKNSHD